MSDPLAAQPGVDVSEGRALLAAATEGPWTFYNDDLWHGWTADELAAYDADPDLFGDLPRKVGNIFAGDVEEPADAELIAWLFTNAAVLLDAYEAVQRVRGLADTVRTLQSADPDTGDRDVSFFALLDALEPDDE